MAIEPVILKRNDTREAIEMIAQEEDENGVLQVMNLPSGTGVEFHMVQGDVNPFTGLAMPSPGTVVVNAPGYLIPATPGGHGYQWQPGDTTLAGGFYAEFQFTFDDGRVLTFPNDENIPVHITPDLA